MVAFDPRSVNHIEKECVKIDYLRFVSNTETIDRDKLIKEFKLNPSKKIIYWLPQPISKGLRCISGAIVVWFHGPTFNCGLAGSLLS